MFTDFPETEFVSNRFDHDHEKINSDIMTRVSAKVQQLDFSSYTEQDVERLLSKDRLSLDDFAAALSPAAVPYLEMLTTQADAVTRNYFGNSVSLFTPLYISNYCENQCVYCGFNCRNKIHRAALTIAEIESEISTIAQTGLKEILILTGESRYHSNVNYIGQAVRLASRYFPTVGIEIYPLNISEYAYLKSCGADFVSVYQETYNLDTYAKVHLKGPKTDFQYRFNAQERALIAGLRGVSFGSLLGLDEFRKDAFATGLHAYLIQQKFPHAEISFSVPRLKPFLNDASCYVNNVSERDLLQVMLAFRLFLPFAGLTISTRERARFRDHVIGMAATKMSAGVCVGVGGHQTEEKGDQQFEIADTRSVSEIVQMISSRGLQPVFQDHILVQSISC